MIDDDRYEEGYEDGYAQGRHEAEDVAYSAGYDEGYDAGEAERLYGTEDREEEAYDQGVAAGAQEFVNDLSVEKLTTVLIQNWKNWHPNQSHGLQHMLAGEIKNYLEGLV